MILAALLMLAATTAPASAADRKVLQSAKAGPGLRIELKVGRILRRDLDGGTAQSWRIPNVEAYGTYGGAYTGPQFALATGRHGEAVVAWHTYGECTTESGDKTLPCNGKVRVLSLPRDGGPTRPQLLGADLPSLEDTHIRATMTPGGRAIVAWPVGSDQYAPDPLRFRLAFAQAGRPFTMARPDPRPGLLTSLRVVGDEVRLTWVSASRRGHAAGRLVGSTIIATRR